MKKDNKIKKTNKDISHSKKENSKRKTRPLINNEENNLKQDKAKEKKLKKLEKKKKKELKKKIQQIEKNQLEDEKKQKQKIKKKLNQKQIEQFRKTKRRLRNVAIFILILTGIALFLLSPIFTIKNVQVEGNEKISKEEIISLLKISSTTNLFEETRGKVLNSLKENAYIDTVKIGRKLPSTLVVKITERKIEYLLEFGSSFAYIDEEGNILEISDKPIEGVRKIKGFTTPEDQIQPGNIINEEDLVRIQIFDKILKGASNYSIQDKFTGADISDSSNFIIYCENDKKSISFGDDKMIDTKMLYIKAILDKESGNEGEIFVNMDLNNKNPYFKQKV